MVEGIVYLYESPSGKYYVGQTFEELKRRKSFLTKSKYAGVKIDRARLKYGTINFKYTVLFRQMFNNIDEGCISVLYKRKDGSCGIINTT